MNRYRIAMVAACPFPAAFASSGLIRELSGALQHKGHDVHVITYHLGNTSFPLNGIKVHRIPHVPGYQKVCSGIAFTKPLLDLLLARTLYKKALEYNFDIIHTHNYEAPPAGYFVRQKMNIPVVYHAHNTMVHELPSYFRSTVMQSLSRKFASYLDHTIPHKADHIITLSNDQTRYLTSIGVAANRITMITPSIEETLFAYGNGKTIREVLNIGNAPLLIYTGGLQQYQNCELLIELLRHCRFAEPDMHLLILARSEPEELHMAAVTANLSNHIHFLKGQGLAFEKDCLAAATVAVIPRLHCIGFPIKLLNYAAAGVPTVCFESLRNGFENEKEILSVPDGNIADMASRIIRLIRDPGLAERLSENARIRIRKHHNWSDAITQIESIYDQVTVSRDTCLRQ